MKKIKGRIKKKVRDKLLHIADMGEPTWVNFFDTLNQNEIFDFHVDDNNSVIAHIFIDHNDCYCEKYNAKWERTFLLEDIDIIEEKPKAVKMGNLDECIVFLNVLNHSFEGAGIQDIGGITENLSLNAINPEDVIDRLIKYVNNIKTLIQIEERIK